MAIVTYENPAYGFGVIYDDAVVLRIGHAADPRLAAAWKDRIPGRIAVDVLFTTPAATAHGVARGLVPSLLLTTDATPLEPLVLASWDWDEAGDEAGRRFLEMTGAPALEALGLYWRGFPVLQLTTAPPADAEPPAPVECLSLLHTPAQTFAIELVVPVHDLDEWSAPLQQVADGFFLMPMEREGTMRTGHQHVWSRRIEAADLLEDARRDAPAR